MGFSRQEYWSRLPFSPLGIFQIQGLNPHLLQWQADSSPLRHLARPRYGAELGSNSSSSHWWCNLDKMFVLPRFHLLLWETTALQLLWGFNEQVHTMPLSLSLSRASCSQPWQVWGVLGSVVSPHKSTVLGSSYLFFSHYFTSPGKSICPREV